MKLKDHPIAELFPLMPDDEITELAADIKKHGCKTRITLYEDMILDGRNRYRACLRAHVEPKTQNYSGTNAQALVHVVSLNLHRRQLTVAQRAGVALKLASFQHGGDRKTDQAANLPLEKAAEMLNVSERSVRMAREIEKASPAKAAEVAAGSKSLHKAAEEIKVEAAPKKKPVSNLPVDSRGVPVPADKMALWARRFELDELTTAISKLRVAFKKAYADHDPLFAHVDPQMTGVRLDAVYHSIASGKPWCVCPMCQGASCRACKGTGFMGKFQFSQHVPAELKKASER